MQICIVSFKRKVDTLAYKHNMGITFSMKTDLNFVIPLKCFKGSNVMFSASLFNEWDMARQD